MGPLGEGSKLWVRKYVYQDSNPRQIGKNRRLVPLEQEAVLKASASLIVNLGLWKISILNFQNAEIHFQVLMICESSWEIASRNSDISNTRKYQISSNNMHLTRRRTQCSYPTVSKLQSAGSVTFQHYWSAGLILCMILSNFLLHNHYKRPLKATPFDSSCSPLDCLSKPHY